MTGGVSALSVASPDPYRWRAMTPGDLDDVVRLADLVHPALREDVAVFRNRLALYPEGCFVLTQPDGDKIEPAGYAVGHPWRGAVPPKLGAVLDGLPAEPDRFYIHDVALAPDARGRGLADEVVTRLLDCAEPFGLACLVSVYGTAGFWRRHGFEDAAPSADPQALGSYGDDARSMVRLP